MSLRSSNSFEIAVLPGDGIGPEVMAPCLEVLAAALTLSGGFGLNLRSWPAGAGHYRSTGDALPKSTLDACRSADAILLAAMGLPGVRQPDGAELTSPVAIPFEIGP